MAAAEIRTEGNVPTLPRSTAAASPIGPGEFDGLMQRVGPFEPHPVIAVAVSGGADSMALAHLVAGWARRHGATMIGVTVDHRLRPGSGREARQVGTWLGALGVPHHVLRWDGAKPASGVQAAAREARYALLTAWARRRGVLHLLVAHQREDQAETFLMRLARSSGPSGLAGMPAISEATHVRIIRPLLTIPRRRLEATLEGLGQPWIADPTNDDPAYTRVQIRKALPELAHIGLTPGRIAAAVDGLARSRAALETATASLLARAVDIYPTGHASVRAELLANAPSDVALGALGAVVTCVGGRAYGPRIQRLERLYQALGDGKRARGRTLSGCLVMPRRGGLLIVREPASITHEIVLDRGTEAIWDSRFRVRVGRSVPVPPGLTLGPLGESGWARLVARAPEIKTWPLPRPVWLALPAVKRRKTPVFLPSFPDCPAVAPRPRNLPDLHIEFCPPNSLAKPTFSVV